MPLTNLPAPRPRKDQPPVAPTEPFYINREQLARAILSARAQSMPGARTAGSLSSRSAALCALISRRSVPPSSGGLRLGQTLMVQLSPHRERHPESAASSRVGL